MRCPFKILDQVACGLRLVGVSIARECELPTTIKLPGGQDIEISNLSIGVLSSGKCLDAYGEVINANRAFPDPRAGLHRGVAGVYNRAAYTTQKAEALAQWADHLGVIVA